METARKFLATDKRTGGHGKMSKREPVFQGDYSHTNCYDQDTTVYGIFNKLLRGIS